MPPNAPPPAGGPAAPTVPTAVAGPEAPPAVIAPDISPSAPVEKKPYEKPGLLKLMTDKPVTKEEARGVLEKIAESGTERFMQNHVLEESARLFLEIKDTARFLLATMARNTSDTDLGRQFRSEIIQMISGLKPESVSDDIKTRLVSIQKNIEEGKLLEGQKPAENPFRKWMKEHGIEFPRDQNPSYEIVMEIFEKSKGPTQKALWADLMGKDAKMEDYRNPQRLIQLANISTMDDSAKQEVVKSMQKFFNPKVPLKDRLKQLPIGQLLMGGMGAFALLMILGQFMQEGEGSGRGHQGA